MDASLLKITFVRELQRDMLMVTDADMEAALADQDWIGEFDDLKDSVLLGELSKEMKVVWALYYKVRKTVEAAENAFLFADEEVSPAMSAELDCWRRKQRDLELLISLCLDREFHPQGGSVPRNFEVAGFVAREKVPVVTDFLDTLPG